jgi:ketosteroid isomerase-like protein
LIYRTFVRRRVRGSFAALSRGDMQAATKGMAEDVHHVFPGDNAFGGERHSRQAFERWLERLTRLIPDLEFEVREVAVRGWPWDTAVAVQWTDHGHTADGQPYSNEGAHWMRIRWGKAVEVHAYLDTEKVTVLAERLAEAGFDEAAAPPITS